MKVHASDGTDLGKVVACGEQTFLIEKGFFFPKDYYARYDLISDIRDSEIWLSESGELLKQHSGEASEEHLSEKPYKPEGQWAGGKDEYRIPLSEEELSAEKNVRQAGEVRVRKDVTTEEKQFTVPVSKERVTVERVPASNETPASGESMFKQSSVSIPISEEEVEIRKRPVVREELRIRKEVSQEERRLSAEARKETAEVETKGDVKTDEEGEGSKNL